MKAHIAGRGRLAIISNSEVDPVPVLLTFARAHEIDWSDVNAAGSFLYNIASAMLVAVSQCNAIDCKLGRCGDPLPGAARPKVASRYVEKH